MKSKTPQKAVKVPEGSKLAKFRAVKVKGGSYMIESVPAGGTIWRGTLGGLDLEGAMDTLKYMQRQGCTVEFPKGKAA